MQPRFPFSGRPIFPSTSNLLHGKSGYPGRQRCPPGFVFLSFVLLPFFVNQKRKKPIVSQANRSLFFRKSIRFLSFSAISFCPLRTNYDGIGSLSSRKKIRSTRRSIRSGLFSSLSAWMFTLSGKSIFPSGWISFITSSQVFMVVSRVCCEVYPVCYFKDITINTRYHPRMKSRSIR